MVEAEIAPAGAPKPTAKVMITKPMETAGNPIPTESSAPPQPSALPLPTEQSAPRHNADRQAESHSAIARSAEHTSTAIGATNDLESSGASQPPTSDIHEPAQGSKSTDLIDANLRQQENNSLISRVHEDV